MSQIEDTIAAVAGIKQHVEALVGQVREAITLTEQGAEAGEALGFEPVVEIYNSAKTELEALVGSAGGFEERVDAVVEGLEAGKSG